MFAAIDVEVNPTNPNAKCMVLSGGYFEQTCLN